MIKTIKVKKNMRLDELIKYVWDNKLFSRDYKVDGKIGELRYVTFNEDGMLRASYGYHESDTFTVEVEEEITKNTPFEWIVALDSYGSLARYEVATITDVLSYDGADCFATKMYALIRNKLELIWEAE